MLNLTLKEITELSNGQLNNEKFSDIVIPIVSIDTRTLDPGDMYMPIIGEKLDGHLFIDQAFEKGAAATFSKIGEITNDQGRPIIWVEDSNKAFKELAKNYRNSLDLKLIAITGSNGKTTTKDLIANVLEKKYSVKKTIGNLNNDIGVPKTILTFDKDTNIGIVEMGIDNFEQMNDLTTMGNPDIAIITNIGDSHLQQLKTKENVAEEKLHIIDGLKEDGVFIYNNDDPVLREKVKELDIKHKLISFGTSEGSDYKINVIESNSNGSLFEVNGKRVNTSLIGHHQILNSTVAIIVGKLLGVENEEIIDGLTKKDLTKMRSELLSCDGFDILNDSYKSNPQSLRSALDTLNLLNGYSRKIAILGDMLELGSNEEELHRQIGRELSPEKIDYLLLYGPLSKFIYEEAMKNYPQSRVFHFETKDQLIDKAKYLITRNSISLVKASRSLRLEEIVEALEQIRLI